MIGLVRATPTIAQDRDPVGDLEDLVEVVADEQQGDAGAAQAADHPEDLGNLTWLERRRRLVEDDDRASVDTARTMAIICWTPAPNEFTGRRTSMSIPYRRNSAVALRFISPTSSSFHLDRGSLPRYRLRATDIIGTSVISWNVVLMPRSQAARGDDSEMLSPQVADLALVGGCRPR